MSGIAGIVRFDGRPVELGEVEKMTGAMPYRGPDGINHWVSSSAALGHCMLCTTPESLEEQQPLISEDGSLIMVMDGRVDNWVELRKELTTRGIRLRDKSDAELVLQAYQRWGEECLAHIDGDFALAIWNTQSQTLFCARDPLGNKPFNYYWDGKTLVFASELHAILALPEVPQVLNLGVVAEFLAADLCSRADTFWQGIQRLVAAHVMTVDSAGLKLEQYWSPDLWATLPYVKDEDFIEHYRQSLFETIRRQSRSNRPIASEVSGGLDSSAIFAVAEHLRRENRLLAPSITGYTMDFSFDPDANELDYCRAVGQMYGKTIIEVAPSMQSVAWYQAQGRHYRDFPSCPNGAMASGLMQSVCYAGSRVVFNGVGGDEWLGGSPIYYAEEMAAMRLRNITQCLIRDVRKVGYKTSIGWLLRLGAAQFLPDALKSYLRELKHRRVDSLDSLSWLAPSLRKVLLEQQESACSQHRTPLRWPGQHVELARLADAQSIQAHELHERMGASFGLECRRPFYSVGMVQLSFMMPKRLLYQSGINRYVHRKALDGLLPNKVLQRECKAEFSITYRHVFSEMEELLVREIPGRRTGWIDSAEPAVLYENQGRGKYDGCGDTMLWNLFGCDTFCPID